MRICPKCKKTIENDMALFCRYCGTKLPEVPKTEETPAPQSNVTPASSSMGEAEVTADKPQQPTTSEETIVVESPQVTTQQPLPNTQQAVPPPLPPLPQISSKKGKGEISDDEVTIIYTPSETPPPIPSLNPNPDPSSTGEGSDSFQVQGQTQEHITPLSPTRGVGGKAVGSSSNKTGIIIAVVVILLVILGVIAFGLYYNGVFGSRSTVSYEPEYEAIVDSIAASEEDNSYDNNNDCDDVEYDAPASDNYDNVDNVIDRIGTDDEYYDDEYYGADTVAQ